MSCSSGCKRPSPVKCGYFLPTLFNTPANKIAVKLPIIGIGGVMNATDALEFILAGATAVQVGTASFINPGAAQKIAEDMEAWMLAQGETDIRNLIGALKV